MYIRRFHRYLNEAAAVVEAGAAASPAAAPAPAAAALAPAAAAPAPTSALASGAAAAAAPAAAAPAASEEFKFADKVIVKNGEAIDWEATARKSEQGRQHLETRLGAGDAPPASAAEYKVNVPEALKDKVNAEELAKAPDFQAFLGKLHAAKAPQAFVDIAVAELLERGVAIHAEKAVMDEAECVATLRQAEGWKTEGEYKAQIGAAFRAAKAYAGANFDSFLKEYGNDPMVLQVLAAVGKELAEDRQAGADANPAAGAKLDELMSSPAYLNENNPQHASVKAQVEALQAKVSGTAPVVGGKSMSFNT